MTSSQIVADRPITEGELRRCVHAALTIGVETRGARIFQELQIEHGAARVDLAVVSDRLEAFELKSDLDNLGRLHNQIHAYNRVFDRITLVTGSVFSNVVQSILPHWWGIATVHRLHDGSLTMIQIRDSKDNPVQDRLSLAMCLRRDEAKAVVSAIAENDPSERVTKSQLHEWIAANMSLDAVRASVTRWLLERPISIALKLSKPNGDSLHLDANCSDFHFLT
jgi:hypothetical protein